MSIITESNCKQIKLNISLQSNPAIREWLGQTKSFGYYGVRLYRGMTKWCSISSPTYIDTMCY